MLWLLLLTSILFASLNSVLLHKLPAKSNLYAFNMICSVAWIGILFALNGLSLTLTPAIVLWGIIYGITQELFIFFKAQAMKSGPVSITTLIGNCSLILSTSVGVIAWQESVSAAQILGIFLLLGAFFLCTYNKSEKAEQVSKKWLLYCLFFFAFAAGVGIIFKAFSKAESGASAGDMMIVSSVTMLIFSGIKLAASRFSAKSENKPSLFSKSFLAIAVISGILSCGYNRLNMFLAGLFDSAIFYPCFNGGVILASSILSVIFLGERLTRRQIIGLIIGVLAVIITGMF